MKNVIQLPLGWNIAKFPNSFCIAHRTKNIGLLIYISDRSAWGFDVERVCEEVRQKPLWLGRMVVIFFAPKSA